jgi:hypothetical protein
MRYRRCYNVSFGGQRTMESRYNSKPLLEAEALVHRVDPVTREVAVLVGGALVTIYVPPDCGVFLHAERVKLRLVQPGDRVRVTYTEHGDSLIAREIEVRPVHMYPSLTQ